MRILSYYMWVLQFWRFTQWRISLTYATIQNLAHQIVKDIGTYMGIAILVGVHTLRDFGWHVRMMKKMCPSFKYHLSLGIYNKVDPICRCSRKWQYVLYIAMVAIFTLFGTTSNENTYGLMYYLHVDYKLDFKTKVYL